MFRSWMKLSLLPTLAATVLFAACEQGNHAVLGPQSGPDEVLITTTQNSGYTTVKETDASVGVVAGIIGSAGGKLVLGKHSLEVPAGAVDAPTTFTMTKLSGELHVELTATRLLPNDVGSRGFAVPLKLSLSFEKASQLPSDLSTLGIFWVKSDGSLVAQSTAVDIQGKRAIGSLNHFSGYALAWP